MTQRVSGSSLDVDIGKDRTGPVLLLQILRYGSPFATVASFFIARVICSCLLTPSSNGAKSRPRRRHAAIAIQTAATLLLIAEGVTYVVRAFSFPGWAAPQDAVVFVLFSVAVETLIALCLFEETRPIWHPYLAAWIIDAFFQIAVSSITTAISLRHNKYDAARDALSISRSTILLALVISQGLLEFSSKMDQSRQQLSASETTPLLPSSPSEPGQPSRTDADCNEAGDPESDASDLDSDCEDEDDDKKLRQARQERLQKSGSWLNYIKEYKVFVPLILPSGNRRVQFSLAVIAVVMVAQRFLTVLVPRQLGILTDDLTETAGSGVLPWRSFYTWAILVWLNSAAGLSVLTSVAELPAQQYAYKAIGMAAFRHVMSLSMDFHNDKNSGELISAISQGQYLQNLIEFLAFNMLPAIIDLIVGFGYVYYLFDIYMVSILLFVAVLYTWLGFRITAWGIEPRRNYNKAWRAESKVLTEGMCNWTTVSHFNRADYECKRYEETLQTVIGREWAYYFALSLGYGAQAMIMQAGCLSASLLAAYRVSQGTARVGQFVTLLTYWGAIEGPLGSMSHHVRTVSRMFTDAERLLQVLTTKATVTDSPNARPLQLKAGRVDFADVNFAYDARKPTIQDVSFTAEPGMTIAFVGETGGGKSTLLKLLYRYYDVTGGSIRIDGQDVRGVTLDSLRDCFGMVPQDPSLFNTSVMENIRYARLDATDEEVREACRAAAIHDKIASFPDGYASKVGERGVKLSGGEMQRVAIARAILRQPKLVLLDEATSMIDAETESLIQQALRKLTAGRTTFIVAHRLSTIQHVDLILVIHGGRIIERGTHDELFRQNGKYFSLWSKQMSKAVRAATQTLDGSGSDESDDDNDEKDDDNDDDDDKDDDNDGDDDKDDDSDLIDMSPGQGDKGRDGGKRPSDDARSSES